MLVAAAVMYPQARLNAKIPLSELRGFSMNSSFIYLAPAMGVLYETYAKNLALLGNQTSEAVILTRELVDSTNSPAAIGRYLGPTDIGTLIGLVIQRKNDTIDEWAMIRAVGTTLKKVITRKHHEIKKAIMDDLKQAIKCDNNHYKELEHSLLELHDKKDRADVHHALLHVSRSWNTDTETVVINKLNSRAQQNLFTQLKQLHRKLRQNRTFLDLEQRSCDIASPQLKDSMGAFAHALAGALAEEGTIYLNNNTINLLLALLVSKANTHDEIIEALKSIAHTLTIEPDDLYTWHHQDPYTTKHYETLKTKTESDIAALPLEDVVSARFAQNRVNSSTTTLHDAYRTTYFKSFINQSKSVNNSHQKALLESLVASWAPSWQDINNMDPKIIYCRFLMQKTDTVAERISLIADLCDGTVNMTGMIGYYLDAIANIYQSLPKDFDAQQQFFNVIIPFITNEQSITEFAKELKDICTHLIKDAHDDASKAAVLHSIIKNHLFDTNAIEKLGLFDTEHTIASMLKTIQSDAHKAELIKLILKLEIPKDNPEKQSIQELHDWAMATVPTIKNEATKN